MAGYVCCSFETVRNSMDIVSLECDVAMVADCVESKHLRLNTTKIKCMLVSRKRNRPALTQIDDSTIGLFSLPGGDNIGRLGLVGPYLHCLFEV